MARRRDSGGRGRIGQVRPPAPDGARATRLRAPSRSPMRGADRRSDSSHSYRSLRRSTYRRAPMRTGIPRTVDAVGDPPAFGPARIAEEVGAPTAVSRTACRRTADRALLHDPRAFRAVGRSEAAHVAVSVEPGPAPSTANRCALVTTARGRRRRPERDEAVEVPSSAARTSEEMRELTTARHRMGSGGASAASQCIPTIRRPAAGAAPAPAIGCRREPARGRAGPRRRRTASRRCRRARHRPHREPRRGPRPGAARSRGRARRRPGS